MPMPEMEEHSLQFDSKIGLTQVVALLTAMFSIAAAYFTLKADIATNADKLATHEQRLNTMDAATVGLWATLNDIKRDMAVVRYQLEMKIESKEDKK